MSGTTMGSAAITDLVPKDQIGKAMSCHGRGWV